MCVFKRARARARATQLRINELTCSKYRYNLNARQRLYPLCQSAEEDEIHFIFACRAYDDIRKVLFPLKLLQRNSTVNSLAELLQHENVPNLAKVLVEGLKRRQDITASELPPEK